LKQRKQKAIQTPPRPILYRGIFDRKKNEAKPEFSKTLDEVFPRSNRRYKLRFHRGSIAENAPILSSGTVALPLSIDTVGVEFSLLCTGLSVKFSMVGETATRSVEQI